MRTNDFYNIIELVKRDVLDSEREYLKLLKVIGNNQRYDFLSQLSIYDKNPNATACASFDMWRKRFNRTVMRGQKDIPILNDSNAFQKVGYIFDISQTVSMDKNVNEVELWSFDREKHENALEDMRNTLEQMANENHEDFAKALISFEKGINDKDALDKLYQEYMDNDSMSLLNDEFDYLIDELRENGQIKDSASIEKEYNDLVNIVGNIVGEVETIERENKNGEAFKVVNFSVVSKDDEGNKIYTNCSAYGDKGDIPKNFKQGDFVKLFGQIRISIDDNGKEHTNIRIFSSKLLKAKEQMRGQEEKKESVLGAIKKYQVEDKEESKEKPKEKKEATKETERQIYGRCGLRTAPALFYIR